jgi:hypothetical protein
MVKDAGHRPVVHCFGGCEFRDVVRELEARGLWQKSERPPGPPPKKVEWARWCVAIFEEAKRTGQELTADDWRDYRKAQAVLREVDGG